MPLPARSLLVVGADYPNKRGPTRRFEIAICLPGEPVHLEPEPKNPKDPHAVMVMSVRGVQIGYLRAEHAPWIGAQIRAGREISAVFQQKTDWGAAIRVAFDGETPVLSAVGARAALSPLIRQSDESGVVADPDPGFYPDDDWPE